ncbi:DUF1659 domain-containing protein [Microaerobacter geothermalis]|uniref:DUF1659 domain-containing protein n=1 Tax=Microaerobacter geothermalis TaxID=674972 RepID=UPI001F229C04|nr:DUF1659 domain-containing protein [Microaerobacter geothermalis]MCF6095308.1 DUF1659 domain-containing protein [Microaerobacter geothermalis]
MPVISTPNFSRIVIAFQTGVDANGNPVKQSKSYNRVKPSSTDQDVYDVANALAGLQSNPVLSIQRFDQEELSQ